MFTLPNIFSLTRIPLAILFWQGDFLCRLIAIILALITDGLDGFIARRYHMMSRLGVILDPLADRFFAAIAMYALYEDRSLELWQVAALCTRDLALAFFGVYLLCTQQLKKFDPRALWSGKITTVMQMILFTALIFAVPIPSILFYCMIALGAFAFLELYISPRVVAILP